MTVRTSLGTIATRPETEADSAFLYALFETVRGPDFAALPIDPAPLLRMQFLAMTRGYRASFPQARFDIVTLNGDPAGQSIVDRTASRFHIVYIALMPEWRNRGLATALLSPILNEARHLGRPVEATAAIGNIPSLRLWHRLGFEERSRNETDIAVAWQPPPPDGGG